MMVFHFEFSLSVTDGKGQHCCYNEHGHLITGPPSGGTVDLWSEDISLAKHYRADVEPFLMCCKGELPNCESYYMRRPSDDGSRFDPLPCGEYVLNIMVYFLPHIYACVCMYIMYISVLLLCDCLTIQQAG